MICTNPRFQSAHHCLTVASPAQPFRCCPQRMQLLFPPAVLAIQPTNMNIHAHVSTHRHQDRVTISPRTSVSHTLPHPLHTNHIQSTCCWRRARAATSGLKLTDCSTSTALVGLACTGAQAHVLAALASRASDGREGGLKCATLRCASAESSPCSSARFAAAVHRDAAVCLTMASGSAWTAGVEAEFAAAVSCIPSFVHLCHSGVHKRGNEEQRLSKPKSRLVQLVPLGACHPRRGCDRVLRRMRSCSSQCCCLAAAASCCHPRVWAVLASIAAYACTGRGIGGLIGPRCWMPRGRATVRSQGLRRKGVGGRGAVLVGGKGAVLAGLALPRGEARRGLGTVGRVSAMTSGCP